MVLSVKARGKINWTLDVLGQRPDGYHDLDMLLSSVTLCDQIRIEPAEELTMSLGNSGRFVPSDDRNLVMKAARLLKAEAGSEYGASIVLRKYIPVCSGMGGGSSDAAAVLLALNKMWKCHLNMKELEALAVRLGADVPYCLHGGLARVQGIGERVTPLAMRRYLYLIALQPCRGLSTKDVFESLHTDGIEPEDRPDNAKAMNALMTGNINQLPAAMGNVLEPVSLKKCPEMKTALDHLLESGAIAAQMTGSGSVVYGLYPNAWACHQALDQITAIYPNARAMRTVESGVEITEER